MNALRHFLAGLFAGFWVTVAVLSIAGCDDQCPNAPPPPQAGCSDFAHVLDYADETFSCPGKMKMETIPGSKNMVACRCPDTY